MLKKSLILLALLPLVAGCSDNPVIQQSPEEVVIANSYLVQRAVEAFAAENNGEYPQGTLDKSLQGNTLIDLLPGGRLLMNPYTLRRNVPNRWVALFPGETGYRPYHPSWTTLPTAGYSINGMGEHSEVIFLSKNYPDSIRARESAIVANCWAVMEAAEAFAAENNGVYASNVNRDTTLAGNTIIDLLPGGEMLVNPFINLRVEPLNGVAGNPGQTGYVPVIHGGINVGYTITGYAEYYTIVMLHYNPQCPTHPCVDP
jgi:hypothetical protein